VISMHEESLYAERVLRAGARGYITKHAGGDQVIEAVRQVLRGEIYVSNSVSARILEIFSGRKSARKWSCIEQLSDREFEVFELIGTGLSSRDMAGRLQLSAKTVDTHRASIKKKLNLKTTSELISYSARWAANRDVMGR
jgi:DNA-binding NarL/FixJ family response regulator